MFLQQNAEAIMDREWTQMKQTKADTCVANECIHKYPTRVNPPWFVEERQIYDSAAYPENVKKYPCKKQNGDYRLTVTKQGNPNRH
jgi:hypothetical protein